MIRQSPYLHDLLILTNSSFKEHLTKLESRYGFSKTLNRWYESEYLQIYVLKFLSEQIEYLAYWITRQGIQPLRNKAEVIFNIMRLGLMSIKPYLGLTVLIPACFFLRVTPL
jgi:hypothetical protein